jgi:hypothetical protein
MRHVLLALTLLGCAHPGLLRARAASAPLPADGPSANLHGEHGARAAAHPERAMATSPEAPSLQIRFSHRVTATPRLTFDPAIDKRVLRRLREPSTAPLNLPEALTDLSLDDASTR